ncbi:hypothetical protein C1D09_032015 [Mesorhizobium intechi]|uniref:hypothetical protein n=1 Tax=Mesorhizobium intechi TaxID=537601 RepID=UPI000CBF5483|nr:hypothetical protein [Mesorhizobium intechi]TSE00555.1 hypothetical protein C1D09_032015 [Mesorhizobium intechi]
MTGVDATVDNRCFVWLDINTEWVSCGVHDRIRNPIKPPATKRPPDAMKTGDAASTHRRDFVAVCGR